MKSTSYNIEAREIEAGEHSNTNLLIYFYFVFLNLNVVSGRIMQTKYDIYIWYGTNILASIRDRDFHLSGNFWKFLISYNFIVMQS